MMNCLKLTLKEIGIIIAIQDGNNANNGYSLFKKELDTNLMTNEKSIGKIIKVQREKGFGFIISPEHKYVKFFFHWTGLIQSTLKFTELSEGMKVKFVSILESINNQEVKSKGPTPFKLR